MIDKGQIVMVETTKGMWAGSTQHYNGDKTIWIKDVCRVIHNKTEHGATLEFTPVPEDKIICTAEIITLISEKNQIYRTYKEATTTIIMPRG